MRRVIIVVVLAMLASAPALAERPPYRFELNLGAYVPSMDTTIRIDGTGVLVLSEFAGVSLSSKPLTHRCYDWVPPRFIGACRAGADTDSPPPPVSPSTGWPV